MDPDTKENNISKDTSVVVESISPTDSGLIQPTMGPPQCMFGTGDDQDCPMKPSVEECYAGRNVLITGVTGFMGKVLLEKLLRGCPNIGTIYCLIRPMKGKTAQTRLDDLMQSKLFASTDMSHKSKVTAIHGDVSMPDLGMNSEDIERVIEDVSIVFHSAATVKFDEMLRVAVQLNVLGVKCLVDLCHRMKHLDALVHVSTAYANCNRNTVDECFYPPPLEPKKLLDALEWMSDEMVEKITPNVIGDRPNTYTYTKAMAEHVLVTERGSLPVAVVRPSIVGAAWREPVQGWIDNYNGPTGLLAAIGKGLLRTMVGQPDSVADIVPVDIPVNLMIAVGWYTAVTRPSNVIVYNCTSGGLNKLTWGELERCSFHSWMKNPVDYVVRVPNPRFTSNSFMYEFWRIMDHMVPAYFMDTYNSLFGREKKPKLLRVYKSLHKAIGTLDYFTSHEWDFGQDNTRLLLNELSDPDRKEFNFDLRGLHWPTYIENYCLGTKKFILKEDLSGLPAARRYLKRLQMLGWMFNILLFVVLWRLIIARSPLGRKVWYFTVSLAIKLVKNMPLMARS